MDYAFLAGISILLLGVPIGNFLAKSAKEEINMGQKWFKLISLIGLIGALIGLLLRNDAMLFSFAFISIVSSRSITKKKKVKK